MKIKEYEYDLALGDLGYCFCEYDNGYICDIMHEIADMNTDCYNSDLLNWLSNNLANAYYIEKAVDEYGIDNKNFDFYRLIAQGQYMQNYEDLQEHLNDALLNYAFNYIENFLDDVDVTQEQFEELTLKNYERFERLEDIDDFVKSVLEVE
jgi:hypothetical protein